jgi:hypothetical protein
MISAEQLIKEIDQNFTKTNTMSVQSYGKAVPMTLNLKFPFHIGIHVNTALKEHQKS